MSKHDASNEISVQQFTLTTILGYLIQFAEHEQWDYKKWFEGSDLDIEKVRKTNNIANLQQICKVIHKAILIQQYPNLGLKIGMHTGLISMGILGFAMQSCKTVAEAFQIALRYHRIAGSVLNFEFSIKEDICSLEVTDYFKHQDLKTFFYDEFFSSLVCFLNKMIGDHNDIISLDLTQPSPKDPKYYNEIFNCPIKFQNKKNIIRFKSSILDRKLIHYSPLNRSTAIEICESLLNKIEQMNQDNYIILLDYLIDTNLPKRTNIYQAIEYLKISERSLRKQLAVEGTTFQQIKQNVLERNAKKMLRKNISVSEISDLLGFSEIREFRRAFKRWTGLAPSVYKQRYQMDDQ
ncbi:AraC family transcriptional regulator [Acinetobacter guillouiae]|uniref:AraC family transcriptional regulator n=1 Tax=Acinetobacter guillouiae TaxID=106649 RepID=UPI003340922E